MSILEVVLIGIGLAMDAFAVSVCKGLSMNKFKADKVIIIGFYFGIFQAVMPLIGYLLGSTFQEFISSIDHWIAFVLLAFIGFNMIKETLSKKEDKIDDSVDIKTMVVLAIATSIDALAVGITFAFLEVNIIMSMIVIGLITFLLCIIGVIIGNKYGSKFEDKAQIIGGVVLIIIGLKILIEHLFF